MHIEDWSVLYYEDQGNQSGVTVLQGTVYQQDTNTRNRGKKKKKKNGRGGAGTAVQRPVYVDMDRVEYDVREDKLFAFTARRTAYALTLGRPSEDFLSLLPMTDQISLIQENYAELWLATEYLDDDDEGSDSRDQT